MFRWISQIFCTHDVVRVIRYHASTVPPAWRKRLLYIDRHGVHNFVQCARCEKILHTDQTERLFDQEGGTEPTVVAWLRPGAPEPISDNLKRDNEVMYAQYTIPLVRHSERKVLKTDHEGQAA